MHRNEASVSFPRKRTLINRAIYMKKKKRKDYLERSFDPSVKIGRNTGGLRSLVKERRVKKGKEAGKRSSKIGSLEGKSNFRGTEARKWRVGLASSRLENCNCTR